MPKPLRRILVHPEFRPIPQSTTALHPELGGVPAQIKSDGMMPEKIVLDKRIETFYFLDQFFG
jgi:hypothetical protein